MRPFQVHLCRRAALTAAVVTCASSLQFAGCLNNPTYSDLAAEAEKAAVRAEQEITQQKVDKAHALAASNKAPIRDEHLTDAGGSESIAETNSPILQTGGETQSEEKTSFWSFWKRKPAASKTTEDQDKGKSSVAESSPGKVKLSTSSFETPKRPAPQKTHHADNSWFNRDLVAEVAGQQAQLKAMASAEQEREPQSNPQDKTSSRPFPSVSWNEPPAGAEESDTKVTTQANDSLQASRTSSARAAMVRQQKLRVQALLSDAHTSELRGELHAAYRSALLAEKIVDEYQIDFDEDEERPQDYARVIAAKIWRTSNSSEEAYLAATEAASSLQPLTKPFPATEHPGEAREKNSQATADESPFDSFATWVPLPDDIDQPHSISQTPSGRSKISKAAPAILPDTNSSEQSRQLGSLPEIRPAHRDPWVAESQPEPETTRPQPTLTAPSLAAAPEVDRHHLHHAPVPSEEGDKGVQFAIAQTTTETPVRGLNDPFAADPSSESVPVSEGEGHTPRKMASTLLETQRPLLMAPPVPQHSEDSDTSPAVATWEELSQRDSNAPGLREQNLDTHATFKWRLTWAILGLIGAGAATWLGIRISRSESPYYREDEPLASSTPSPEVSQESNEVADVHSFEQAAKNNDDSDEGHLRIKRAA